MFFCPSATAGYALGGPADAEVAAGQPRPTCSFFMRGGCRFGNSCWYTHDHAAPRKDVGRGASDVTLVDDAGPRDPAKSALFELLSQTSAVDRLLVDKPDDTPLYLVAHNNIFASVCRYWHAGNCNRGCVSSACILAYPQTRLPLCASNSQRQALSARPLPRRWTRPNFQGRADGNPAVDGHDAAQGLHFEP
jgi:hypothetical protein